MRHKRPHPFLIYFVSIFGLSGGYYFVFSEFSNFFAYMQLGYPDFEISTVSVFLLGSLLGLTAYAGYEFFRKEPEFPTIPNIRLPPKSVLLFVVISFGLGCIAQKIPFIIMAEKNGYHICELPEKHFGYNFSKFGGIYVNYTLEFCKN